MYFDPLTRVPFYIGKGKDLRIYQHLSNSRQNRKNIKKHEKIRKLLKEGYNKKEFSRKVKTGLTSKQACKLETKLIKKYGRIEYDSGGCLFNILTIPHKGMLGRKHSKETRRKMSRLRKKFLTPSERLKLSKRLTGRKFSKAHLKALSRAHKGWSPPKCWIEKKSKFMRENNPSLKKWVLKSPDGNVVEVVSLKKFCIKNDLSYSSLQHTILSKHPAKNGWMVVSSEYIRK